MRNGPSLQHAVASPGCQVPCMSPWAWRRRLSSVLVDAETVGQSELMHAQKSTIAPLKIFLDKT